MFKPEEFRQFSNYFLANEALSRGYGVEKIFKNTTRSHLKITNGSSTAIIIGQRIPALSYSAHFICEYKYVTKQFLSEDNISVSKGQKFTRSEINNSIEYFHTLQKPVVLKPISGTWGSDVFLNINSIEDLEKKIAIILKTNPSFLLEEQSEGKEYRILATRNEVLGIIYRVPANIVGDGTKTIQELITEKNADPRRGKDHSKALVQIKIDDEVIEKLTEQSLTLDSIPHNNQQILLRNNSNISTGGDSIDYTDKAHPAVAELAKKVIRAIPDLPYAGFDFLTPDITKDPNEVGYTVIEINDSPMLSMHHKPFEGKERNVSSKIIDLLFK